MPASAPDGATAGEAEGCSDDSEETLPLASGLGLGDSEVSGEGLGSDETLGLTEGKIPPSLAAGELSPPFAKGGWGGFPLLSDDCWLLSTVSTIHQSNLIVSPAGWFRQTLKPGGWIKPSIVLVAWFFKHKPKATGRSGVINILEEVAT